MRINIAIDGPTAAGKGTIAKLLAEKLGYKYLDTGTMYRCIAYKALQEGIALHDEENVEEMTLRSKIEFHSTGEVSLDGVNVSEEIRKSNISVAASQISKIAKVREEMVRQQQEVAKSKGVVMDGRDIGTVVMPDAEVKIFLTADPGVRAQRRFLQNKEKGIASDLETLTQQIVERDKQDMSREHSPLKKAEDAIEIDTTTMTINEVVDCIEKIVKEQN